VHFRNRALGVVDFFVHDVGGAAIDVEDGVHGHAQVLNDTVLAEDFADVLFFDVAREGLDDNLRACDQSPVCYEAPKSTLPLHS
jgi:hypothetical protein